VGGGERQARAAFRLVNRDPTVKRLVAIEALALTGIWVFFVLLRQQSGSSERDVDQLVEGWVYWVAALGIATATSVAIACAVDAKIDGVAGDLGMAFGEVRRRLPAVLGWWLITVVGVVASGYGAMAVMRPLVALFVVTVVWSVGSIFVVPAIALQGGGPLASIGEAARLLRARWGRTLAGLFVIQFLFGLLFIAWAFALRAAIVGHDAGGAEELWRFGGPLLLFYLLYGLMSATRIGLAVILARDALGDLPGEPPAVKRTRTVRRVVFGTLGLAAVAIVVGALVFGPHSNRRSTTSQIYVPAATAPAPRPVVSSTTSFATPLREPQARRLHPGAPVMLAGAMIGHVLLVQIERPSLVVVLFQVERREEETVANSRKKVAMQDGRAYVMILPRGSLGRAPSTPG
jgi:hypothetical protein